jgi:thiol-disulfide isomerase/thioredoxin
MKILLSFFILTSFISCQKLFKQPRPNLIKITIHLDQHDLVSFLEFIPLQKKAILYNGLEKINLEVTLEQEQNIHLSFPFYDSHYELNFKSFKGRWIRDYRGKLSQFPITITEAKHNPFKQQESVLKTEYFQLNDGKILLINHHFNFYSASILSNTGDYRFLATHNKNAPLIFYGHDGAFAFSFNLEKITSQFSFTLNSLNNQYHFTAIKTLSKKPSDDARLTKVKKVDSIDFTFKTLDGQNYQLSKNMGRPKIIQIFASWCPNCIDETQFLSQWQKEHSEQKFDIITICFERSLNEKKALKSINKIIKHFDLKHTFLLASIDPEISVKELLPQIENFKAFPTTLFLDKNHQIKHIHAGFSGPATGEAYDEFRKTFQQALNVIL